MNRHYGQQFPCLEVFLRDRQVHNKSPVRRKFLFAILTMVPTGNSWDVCSSFHTLCPYSLVRSVTESPLCAEDSTRG